MIRILLDLNVRRTGTGLFTATYNLLKFVLPLILDKAGMVTVVTRRRELIKLLINTRRNLRVRSKLLIKTDTSKALDACQIYDIVYTVLPHPIIMRNPYALKAIRKKTKTLIVHVHGYQPYMITGLILAPYENYKDNRMLAKMDRSLFYRAYIQERNFLVKTGLYLLDAIRMKTLREIFSKTADIVLTCSLRHKRIYESLAQEYANPVFDVDYVYNIIDFVEREQKHYKNLDNSFEAITRNFKIYILYPFGENYVKGFPSVKMLLLKISREKTLCKTLKPVLIGFRHFRTLTYLRSLTRKLGLSIEILPILDKTEYISLLKRSHVLLLPTLAEETFSFTVAESLVNGLAPLAHKVGAIPEITPEPLNPFLIDINRIENSEEYFSRITDKLYYLLEKKHHLKKLRECIISKAIDKFTRMNELAITKIYKYLTTL